MRQGKILDTIVYYLSGLLQNKGLLLTLLAIFFVVMVMNFFIISGEAKAVVLIPITLPAGQGAGHQPAGAGSGLPVCRRLYQRPVSDLRRPPRHARYGQAELRRLDRFSWKLWCMLLVAGFAFVLLAQVINLGPF